MKNNSPLVSVIIACYNAENYIDLCISSLVNQTYNNIEIIICDDCSTDNSFQKLMSWAKKDERIKILKNDKNLYAAYSRNRCLEKSKGEYIMIQDIDDISHLDRVKTLLNTLIENPSLSIVSSPMEAFVNDHRIITSCLKQKVKHPTKLDLLWGISFNHPASMITRQCILAVNGYRVSQETRRCQDYDMFMRMYALGYRGINIDKPLYYYRLDEANYKRRTFKARIGEYKIRKLGFKKMGCMPWAYPLTLKPFLAHFVQCIKNIL